MAASFVRFGPAHVWAITLTLITPLVLSALARLDSTGAAARLIAWMLMAFLIVNKMLAIGILQHDGELTLETVLPMHLCDWAAITAVITLAIPNQWTYELCYFWALGGTMQALLTPDILYGFPDLRFVTFFGLHGGVIATVIYATFAMGLRPVPMSIFRVLAWSLIYLGTATATNAMLGTNFGYLRAKPEQPSLLDYVTQGPFFIVQLGLLAIAFALVLYMPFWVWDWLRGR